MRLPKQFNTFSKEEKISYLLNKYSCNEIASILVDYLENTAEKTSSISKKKIRISKEDFEMHFHIISPYSPRKAKEDNK